MNKVVRDMGALQHVKIVGEVALLQMSCVNCVYFALICMSCVSCMNLQCAYMLCKLHGVSMRIFSVSLILAGECN